MFLSKKEILFAVLLCIGLGLAAQPTMSVNAKASISQVNVTPSQIPHPTPSVAFIKEELKVVKKGDNLWDLSKQIYWNGWNFGNLVEENKFLQEPGRLYYDKKTNWFYVMIHPGEKLVTYQPTEPELISIGTPDTAKVDTAGAVSLIVPPVPLEYEKADTTAFWIIASLIGLIILLYLILRFRRKKKEREANPVGSGAPQVVGGVSDETATQRIMNIAEARGMTPLRVTNIQRGRLFGRGNVSYADVPSGLTKRFTGEVGYRGIILRTDGTQETIYFLQGCGNDAQERFFTNLRFVADEIQPEVFRAYNDEHRVPIVDTTEEQKGSTADAPTKPFNSKEQTFVLADKIIEKGLETFFEVSIDGMKFKLDTTNQKKNQGKQVKPSDQSSGK